MHPINYNRQFYNAIKHYNDIVVPEINKTIKRPPLLTPIEITPNDSYNIDFLHNAVQKIITNLKKATNLSEITLPQHSFFGHKHTPGYIKFLIRLSATLKQYDSENQKISESEKTASNLALWVVQALKLSSQPNNKLDDQTYAKIKEYGRTIAATGNKPDVDLFNNAVARYQANAPKKPLQYIEIQPQKPLAGVRSGA